MWTPTRPPSPTPTRDPASVAYTITDLGTLGGAESLASHINAGGQVVGWATAAEKGWHLFLWQNGTMIDLGVVASTLISGATINALGEVAADGNGRGILWRNGARADLGTLPGYTKSSATAINDAGQVVGTAGFADEQRNGVVIHRADTRAFLWQQGTMTELTTPDGRSSEAADINAVGEVVGTVGLRAFLYRDGRITDLGVLPGRGASEALGINNAGQVVGKTFYGARAGHAFLYSGGVMRDLNDLIPIGSRWELDTASDVNDAGQIVGSGTIDGHRHAFLLTPIATTRP